MSPPALVLLHGWGLTPRVWDPLRQSLPSSLVVHAPALPGHDGRATPAASTLDAWSDALVGELPEAAVLCGWSLGGLIALDLAQRYPRKVAGLVLIGTSPCFVARPGPDDPWPYGLDATTVAGFTENFAADPAATLRRFIALQALGDLERRAVAKVLNAALADTDGAAIAMLAAGLRVLAHTDLRASLTAVRQPVHLLHGASDALMPIAAAEWLARQLPDARLTRFDGCGHAPFLSRPVECAELIRSSTLG